MGLRLYKREKLCSVTAIDSLFSVRKDNSKSSQGALISYPIRMVWRLNPKRVSPYGVQFLISVPKKRLHHAVDRVAMRRRIREAYRLNRHHISLPIEKMSLDIAFIYVADKLTNSTLVHASVIKLLQRLSERLNEATNPSATTNA
ncbi:MAG: ribonuclease P protein component [Muribaculum sp.]|nr:ribonuclease P protein component [Muribaculaceae bacterium]MCM1081246.1 ribonuclease P protein component [Muribaculum sp.]